MKKFLFILAVLISSIAYSQTGGQTTYTVTSIGAMKAYFGKSSRIHVTATNEDYVNCPACTPDEVTIYDGAGTRVWKLTPEPYVLSAAHFNGVGSVGDPIVPDYTATATITNKRWTARVGSTTSSGTPTINTDNVDIYKLTAQTEAITSFTTNLTGTPVDGDILEIQITGTAARALTFGASFVSSTVTIPTTTVTTATLSVIFQYYTTSSYGNNKWVCVNSY